MTESFKVACKVSSLKTQLNLANLLIKLPEALIEIEEQEEQKAQARQRWIDSQKADFDFSKAAGNSATVAEMNEERR